MWHRGKHITAIWLNKISESIKTNTICGDNSGQGGKAVNARYIFPVCLYASPAEHAHCHSKIPK
jgi:hypothetical protein